MEYILKNVRLNRKANEALITKIGQSLKSKDGKIRYWLPVKDCDDIYVHITLDTNVIK